MSSYAVVVSVLLIVLLFYGSVIRRDLHVLPRSFPTRGSPDLRAKRMVLLGEMLTAEELLASGFLLRIVERETLDAEADALARRAAENAPLTTRSEEHTSELP